VTIDLDAQSLILWCAYFLLELTFKFLLICSIHPGDMLDFHRINRTSDYVLEALVLNKCPERISFLNRLEDLKSILNRLAEFKA